MAKISKELYLFTLVGRWNFVGYVEHGDGVIRIHDANNVINWGTTEGLGQLAHNGPLGETKLGKMHEPAEFPADREIWRVKCNANAWSKIYPPKK